MTRASDVRALLEAWAGAVRDHDLAGVTRHHAQDLVYFDVPPPTQVRGLQAYADSWPPFFEFIGSSGQFELDELSVSAGEEVAFAHAILIVRGNAEEQPGRVRLTVGLRKERGEWTIVHEHHSAPLREATRVAK